MSPIILKVMGINGSDEGIINPNESPWELMEENWSPWPINLTCPVQTFYFYQLITLSDPTPPPGRGDCSPHNIKYLSCTNVPNVNQDLLENCHEITTKNFPWEGNWSKMKTLSFPCYMKEGPSGNQAILDFWEILPKCLYRGVTQFAPINNERSLVA